AVHSLREAPHDRGLLRALDNCEHLAAACAELADGLLRRCAGVRILATSRQPLGLMGEVAWRVPSLELTVDRSPFTVEKEGALQLSTVNGQRSTLPAAVRLFVARAQ